MSGKRLEIDWGNILTTEERMAAEPELEVVATARELEESTVPAECRMSDHQLEEKIRRLSQSELERNLPDKGQKLRHKRRQYQDELERRKLARSREVAERCETTAHSNDVEASGSFSFFNQMDSISKGKHFDENRCDTPGKRHLHIMSSQSGKISSRKAPFPSATVLASRAKSGSSICREFITTSSSSGLCAGKNIFKRLKSSLGGGTSFLRSKKLRPSQQVVLLDEDVDPMEPARDAFDERKEAKIYYPSRDDPEAVELSCSDMKCLEPEQYLSSSIMNFYILYLQRPLYPVSKPRGEYYFFNTYFYGKLEEAVCSKDERTSRFSKLRRWWKGINIFQKAYIFLPIHMDVHWSLVIISFPPKEDESCPIILHLDSLGLHNSKRIFEVVQSYLTEEWKYMNQCITTGDVPISEKVWVDLPRKIEKKEIKVPQQKNVYDCGLFVLYFMERFIEEAPERLKRKDLGMFGSKWFQPEDASSLRKRLKDLLMEELESESLDHEIEDCQESSSSSSDCEGKS